MFIYNYRIFDRYGVDVISLAILADSVESFRVNKYERKYWGFELRFKFPNITTAERIGIEKGIQQGIQQGLQQGIRQGLLKAIKLGLELKFGAEGLKLYPEIKKIEDVDVLEVISEAIRTAENIEDIKKIYK